MSLRFTAEEERRHLEYVRQQIRRQFLLSKDDMSLPNDSASRKAIPLTTGVLDYFPDALAEVAKVSKAGNDKHNPGQPMHHARGKSTDHADSIARHLMERGGIDSDTGVRHSAELAWRALALLQQELEDAGAPLARGARLPDESETDAAITRERARIQKRIGYGHDKSIHPSIHRFI